MQWERDLSFEQLRGAVELARDGTRLNPAKPGNWLVLSHALAKLGRFEEATGCLREAVVLSPEAFELRLRLVEILFDQDLFDEALSHVERALALSPGEARARRFQFDLLALMGAHNQLDIANLSTFLTDSAHLLNLASRSLGAAGTLELCESVLAERPGHTNATYLKALSLARLGAAGEACGLISTADGLIEIQELPVPPGYADGPSFRQALSEEIRNNPTLAADQKGKAARDSLQTRLLRQPDAVAVEALLRQIRQAVDDYEERVVDVGEELLSHRPERARVEPWAMIYGGEGRQTSHIHPNGWITGVYYVAAARPDGANAYSGHLVMGAVGGKQAADPPWGVREIEPVPGRLVLFPSYVPHLTLPSGVAGDRVSIAFDIVDAGARA
ncbi:MAG TPA: putative 2OG-Fe(II) oxygenase [Stellaceae bacterium]